MATDKIVRLSNLRTFLTSLKGLFVSKESGKGLSTNDYTTTEKTKLAGIATGANAYVLPTASSTVLGGVKIGSNLTISNGVVSAVQGKVDLTPYAKTADIASTYAKKTDISTAFRYRGSVDTYSALPTNGVAVGDVYNVVAADASHDINAGDNVCWNGNDWDNLSGVVDLSAYLKGADAANTYMAKADYPTATDADITALFS
ncbi:head fiber protein [Acidaminococcus fermentans]|uniref:head fiber protein n=1 Tax=Acidaminococcus fermentans TaxID=905 RepID=UPI00242C36A3|nr:head fiber protein [Acidaminococcus fermentans]